MTRLHKSKTKASMKPETTVVINFKGGEYRMHRFPGLLEWFELDMKLHSLLDEMNDGNIQSPIKVIRKDAEGAFKTQLINVIGADRSGLE